MLTNPNIYNSQLCLWVVLICWHKYYHLTQLGNSVPLFHSIKLSINSSIERNNCLSRLQSSLWKSHFVLQPLYLPVFSFFQLLFCAFRLNNYSVSHYNSLWFKDKPAPFYSLKLEIFPTFFPSVAQILSDHFFFQRCSDHLSGQTWACYSSRRTTNTVQGNKIHWRFF